MNIGEPLVSSVTRVLTAENEAPNSSLTLPGSRNSLQQIHAQHTRVHFIGVEDRVQGHLTPPPKNWGKIFFGQTSWGILLIFHTYIFRQKGLVPLPQID